MASNSSDIIDYELFYNPYWNDYVLAKNLFKNNEPFKLVFFIHQRDGNDTELLWKTIKELAEKDKFGYYSAISNDNQVIALHVAITDDDFEEQAQRIEKELHELGVYNFVQEFRANLIKDTEELATPKEEIKMED